MRRSSAILLLGGVLGAALWALEARTQSSERLYVGETACRACHDKPAGASQFVPWRLSKHSMAYAALAMPEAWKIARLSGIHEDPFRSPICLGCHATASTAEEWQLDSGFSLRDGVQCEMCHGPGSEYMDPAIMSDRQKAEDAGLTFPTQATCLVCHLEKGSHTAVLKVRPFDYEQALREIAHPGKGSQPPAEARGAVEPLDGPKYVGAETCAACHDREPGHAFARVRLSAHARAHARLGTQQAKRIAEAEGIDEPRASERCLQCHSSGAGRPAGSFLESFDPAQGVQCEACHGPGSEHAEQAAQADGASAKPASLRVVTRETCLGCHRQGIHGKDFDLDAAWQRIDHWTPNVPHAEAAVEYKTPRNLVVSADGQRLYVACEASDSLVVLHAGTGKILGEVRLQDQPNDLFLAPDGRRLYVSNRASDSVSVVDTGSLQVLTHLRVGDEPHGLATDPEGRWLYSANAASYDVSVVDLAEGREVKRLAASRGTWSIARSPDGRTLYVTNNLSKFVPFRTEAVSEVTVIDASLGRVTERRLIRGANLVQGVDVTPDGQLALVSLLRTKNNVPMTSALNGWVLTNGLGVLWQDGTVDQVLLDDAASGFADPTDVLVTPDGRYALISGGGVDELALVDMDRLRQLLSGATEAERREVFPDRIGLSLSFVTKRIPVGRNPRGLAVAPDGRTAYVAESLDDTVSVIDLQRQERVQVYSLGGPEQITQQRHGERVFHNARRTYARQFACYTCHPDGGVDGLTYDIEADGIGVNPVDNRTLRGILDTAPFKWTGKNPSFKRQCGARLAVFFTRIEPFTPEEVDGIDAFVSTISRAPNRYRAGAELTAAQSRGKALFERTRTNGGALIPPAGRCVTCHPAPYYTSRQKVDVGTRSGLDTGGLFDVPHLNNIYETAPYLHDGRAESLEEIWTRFNLKDEHGVTNDMTKDQLNDLIEYLKTL